MKKFAKKPDLCVPALIYFDLIKLFTTKMIHVHLDIESSLFELEWCLPCRWDSLAT